MSAAAPPRILQVCAVDFSAAHFLLPLMRAQRREGFEVELACAAGDYRKQIEAEGFPLRNVPFARSYDLLAHARAYRALKRLITERGYAAVHAHTPVAAMIARPAARRAGVPVVLYTAHGFYFHDAMTAPVRRAHIALERRAQRHADFLFTQSAEDAATAVREGISSAERTLAIGNGIELARFGRELFPEADRRAVRAEFGIGEGEGPVVAMIGRLVREKGYFELVDAWGSVARAHPKARLLLIGEALASDREDPAALLRARAQELGVAGSVIFAGLRKDVPRLLAASDIFTLPSWREGMPRSILEAMASGLPVVASDIRGCREEVVDGETGRLVPAREAGPLAAALLELVGDPALARRMGEAGRRRAAEHFSEEAVIAKQEAVYRRLFAEKGLAWPASSESPVHS